MITGCLNASNIHATHYALDTALTKQYRILFLSDLHYPATMDAAALEQLCARLSQEQADLLILGGDIVDENTSDEALSIVFEQLGAVETTYGVYYVYGNHDTGSYAALSQRPKQLEQALAANDIHVLRDTSVRIDDELVVIGRDDAKHPLDGQRADGAALLAQAASPQMPLAAMLLTAMLNALRTVGLLFVGSLSPYLAVFSGIALWAKGFGIGFTLHGMQLAHGFGGLFWPL